MVAVIGWQVLRFMQCNRFLKFIITLKFYILNKLINTELLNYLNKKKRFKIAIQTRILKILILLRNQFMHNLLIFFNKIFLKT